MEEHVKVISSLFDVALALAGERALNLENNTHGRKMVLQIMTVFLHDQKYYPIFHPKGRLPIEWNLKVDEESNPPEYIEKGKIRVIFAAYDDVTPGLLLHRDETLDCRKPKIPRKVSCLRELTPGDTVYTLTYGVTGALTWAQSKVEGVWSHHGGLTDLKLEDWDGNVSGIAENTVATARSNWTKKVFINKQSLLDELNRLGRDIKLLIKSVQDYRE